MAADKQTKQLAKQLFKLSLVNGAVSPEQVAGVLGWVEKHSPRRPIALLKVYHHRIAIELAKSHAAIEHAGPVTDTTLKLIEGAMTQKYKRVITSSTKANPQLLAGLRVRIGSDVYESSVAAQLATLSV